MADDIQDKIDAKLDNEGTERVDDIHASVAAAAAGLKEQEQNEKVEEKDPKDAAPEPETKEAAGGKEPEKGALKDEVKEEPGEQKAPDHWPAKAKGIFNRLPADARSFLLDREKDMTADYTRKTQALSERSRQLEGFVTETVPVAQLFQPYREAMKTAGFTMESMIKSWMNVEKRLIEGQGVQVLRDIARAYKIDLKNVLETSGGTLEGRSALPPELEAALKPIQDTLNGFVTEKQQREQNAQREEQTKVEQEFKKTLETVEAFEKAADEKGNLLHPYYTQVRDDMVAMVWGHRQAGQPVPSLDELYNRAIWANTETRQLLQQAMNEAQSRKLADSARAKSTTAKRTGVSVTGSPRSGQMTSRLRPGATPSSNSITDDIRAAVVSIKEAAE